MKKNGLKSSSFRFKESLGYSSHIRNTSGFILIDRDLILLLFFFSEQVPPQIKITGSYGDAALANNAKYRIENAYDGSNDACYIPGTSTNSKASFQIASSLVSIVRVMNRQDCCRKLIFPFQLSVWFVYIIEQVINNFSWSPN